MERNTVQRKILLDSLMKLNTHPTIEELYSEIHEEHPSISKTTVYRNLRQLARNGIIRQVSLSDGLERYDGRTEKIIILIFSSNHCKFPKHSLFLLSETTQRANYCRTAQPVGDFLAIFPLFDKRILQKYSHLNEQFISWWHHRQKVQNKVNP